MIIFDEKKYAERILRNKEYGTLKNQGQERCAIVRYLKFDKGYSDEDILNVLFKIPMHGGESLTKQHKKEIYQRIIEKAPKYEYIKDIEVTIYKSELDIINSIEDENCRNLLFCSLVYYKWGQHIFAKNFYSKISEKVMVLEDDDNISKISKIMKLRKDERFALYRELYLKKYYVQDIIKSKNYFYIPFAKSSGEDVAITINNYNNILGELYLYNQETGYKRCESCGEVIKKNNNKQKYCNNCARIVNINKTREKQNLK